MRNAIAFVAFASIMTALCGCGAKPEQHAAQPEDAQTASHLALKSLLENSLEGALMPGWELMPIEECSVPPGWASNSGKGWHVAVRSAPDTEAGGWRVLCHFWAVQADWVGQKKPLAADSHDATAFYYGQNERAILFVQPPENPAMTQMAVGQVALALGIPDVRAEAASQDKEKAKATQKMLQDAAGAEGESLTRIVDRIIETRFAVITFIRSRNDRDALIMLQALRKAFPEKNTFVINRVGEDLQDSIVAGGKR